MPDLTKSGTNLNTWIGIASVVLVVGMNVGVWMRIPSQMEDNQEETKLGFERVNKEVAELRLQGSTVQITLTQLGKDVGEMKGQLEANRTDDLEQWRHIRDTQAKVQQTVSREVFIEWKAELEKRNDRIHSPPLPKESL